MSAEPALAHTVILQTLRSDYGLEVEGVTFIPGGTAPAYRAGGPGGRFFVKVMPPTAYGVQVKERLEVELPLLSALRHSGVLPRVPRPLATRAGADFAQVEGHALALYGWIDGTNLSSGWTAALHELAPLLGRLHAGTERITGVVPRSPVPPEDFSLPFERGWVEDLRLLKAVPQGARPAVHALHDLLGPYGATLERLLTRARSFQTAARARSRPYVLCHTDAHGGNVMRDGEGELWIIDWETARLAPPEHDLWMLHARLPEVLPAYEEGAGREVELDPDLLGFYFYRRVLEDAAMDVDLILHQNTRPEEDEASLAVLERYILPSVAGMEEELEGLTARLGIG